MKGITFLYNSQTGNSAVSRDQLTNMDRLSYIEQLPDDWNGYGGRRIDPQVIEKCREIIKGICIQPVVFPTGRRTIQLQYELKDKSYLEFEIYTDKIVCMQVPQRVYTNAVFETFIEININKINQIVKEFYAAENKL